MLFLISEYSSADIEVLQRFLPPAYVVRREGTVFTGVRLLTFRRGYPVSGFGGGTRSQVREGYLVSGSGGVPGLRFGGGTRSQVQGGYLVSGPGGGVPL